MHKEECNPDCCLVQAIDDDSNQTAQMTAAILDWPQVRGKLFVTGTGTGYIVPVPIGTGTDISFNKSFVCSVLNPA